MLFSFLLYKIGFLFFLPSSIYHFMEKEKKFVIKGLLLGNENLVLQIFFFSSVKSKIKHNVFFFPHQNEIFGEHLFL